MAKLSLIREVRPNISAIVQRDTEDAREKYREVFPNQASDMLGWLAITEKYPIAKVNGGWLIEVSSELALYQKIEDEYPGGLLNFLEHFPRD